jgi:hypothetical protein
LFSSCLSGGNARERAKIGYCHEASVHHWMPSRLAVS